MACASMCMYMCAPACACTHADTIESAAINRVRNKRADEMREEFYSMHARQRSSQAMSGGAVCAAVDVKLQGSWKPHRMLRSRKRERRHAVDGAAPRLAHRRARCKAQLQRASPGQVRIARLARSVRRRRRRMGRCAQQVAAQRHAARTRVRLVVIRRCVCAVRPRHQVSSILIQVFRQ